MLKVYIFCTDTKLAHCTAVFAQGLLELQDVVIHCNIDCKQPVRSTGIFPPKINLEKIIQSNHTLDEDILIIDESREIGRFFLQNPIAEFYENVSKISRKKPVAIFYMSDDSNATKFPSDIPLYISHKNSNADLNPHSKSLPFASSLDLYKKAENELSYRKIRHKSIINNFNVSFNQSVRALLELALVPILEQDYAIDYDSLSPEDYAKRLASSAAILAYGGSFYQNPSTHAYINELNKDDELFNTVNNFPNLKKKTAVFRWDSWRFWEAVFFGCAPLQLDFEKYGFELYKNPTKWEHYIPVDLSSICSSLQELRLRIKDETNYLVRVGESARNWGLENYHPVTLAQNFLNDFNLVRVQKKRI